VLTEHLYCFSCREIEEKVHDIKCNIKDVMVVGEPLQPDIKFDASHIVMLVNTEFSTE